MVLPRASGILLHPTSLPGTFGIGDIGPQAFRFADFLAATGQHRWQVLPLGPTGFGYSPYSSLSVFAGNPLLISPEVLLGQGLLETSDLHTALPLPTRCVDFEAAIQFKTPLLRRSFEAFERRPDPAALRELDTFCAGNAWWLDDYALFMALKDARGLTAWNTWEEDIRTRQPAVLEVSKQGLAREIRFHRYLQFQFFRQWATLKGYCNNLGISLIGDIPIFVAMDSDAVWAHPGLFQLDSAGQPTVVAGVPPDYFSRTGQRWGNPLYRWDVMAGDGYCWWIDRFRATRTLVDIIRVDHFRGFEKYWEIPASERTAVNGRWVPGPGAALLETLEKALGTLPIIAEDLGTITPEVHALRERFHLPGMKVLQFAWGPGADEYRPHRYPRSCVVYTGTHDNDTTVGWFTNYDPTATTRTREDWQKERHLLLEYAGTEGFQINWDMIRLALMSVADTAIIPMQDILGLGSEARMNRPGTEAGNWRWRFTWDQLTTAMVDRLKTMTEVYGR